MAPIGFFQNHSLFPKLLTQELNCRSLKIINVVHQEPSTNYIPLPIPVPQMSSQHVLHRGGKKGKINCETQFKEFKLYSSQQNTLILLLFFSLLLHKIYLNHKLNHILCIRLYPDLILTLLVQSKRLNPLNQLQNENRRL